MQVVTFVAVTSGSRIVESANVDCIQNQLSQAEADAAAAKDQAKKQLEEARKLTNLKDSDVELPSSLQHVCYVAILRRLNTNCCRL